METRSSRSESLMISSYYKQIASKLSQSKHSDILESLRELTTKAKTYEEFKSNADNLIQLTFTSSKKEEIAMPPPRNPKEKQGTTLFDNIGINMNEEERQLQHYMTRERSHSKLLDEPFIVPADRIEKQIKAKIQENPIMRSYEKTAVTTINTGLVFLMREMMEKLQRTNFLEYNDSHEYFSDREEFKERFRKFLIDKDGNCPASKIICKRKACPIETLKKLEKAELADQSVYEDKCLSKELYSDPQKKVKLGSEETADLCSLLLKNKSEKEQESDMIKRSEEDRMKTIEIFAGNLHMSKSLSKEEKGIGSKNSAFGEVKKVGKNRITLKTLVSTLNSEPKGIYSLILQKAHLKMAN